MVRFNIFIYETQRKKIKDIFLNNKEKFKNESDVVRVAINKLNIQ